ncbi:G5P family DNA-binding protein [Xanthomonas albilineans]|uniref:G5P family DNA-binding protein n=1 Tax=Xanthomonas albilineans TaxID=29447 RepID=UPI001EF094EE|nr:G5P family DNA-binding protein [Xanthomonas albilineans]
MSSVINVRSFPAKEGRAAMHFREQKAAVIRPDDFPLPFPLTLDDDQPPYQEGFYEIDPSSLQLNKFGGLEFGRRIKLIREAARPAAQSKG